MKLNNLNIILNTLYKTNFSNSPEPCFLSILDENLDPNTNDNDFDKRFKALFEVYDINDKDELLAFKKLVFFMANEMKIQGFIYKYGGHLYMPRHYRVSYDCKKLQSSLRPTNKKLHRGHTIS